VTGANAMYMQVFPVLTLVTLHIKHLIGSTVCH